MPNDDRIYHSSCEKNIVRTHFDLPLLRSLRGRKESGLRYFGLPGRECLDIREWRELLTDVVAVDKFADNVRAMRTVLETEFANMRTKAHLGEVDSVIIENIGDANSVAENIARNWVGNEFEDSINSYVWRFDVVNLDYFGNLLPPSNHRNSDPARRRAAALTRLFEKERLDSWQSWVMLLTVGGGRYNAGTQRLLKSYLMDAKNEASADVGEALEFILKPTQDLRVNSAKLVHGTIANLLSGPANDANLEICPRGTIAYLGADNLPMVHLALEFRPRSSDVVANARRLPLLRAPILRVDTSRAEPWFELMPEQCPGATTEDWGSCLDFLPSDTVELLLGG